MATLTSPIILGPIIAIIIILAIIILIINHKKRTLTKKLSSEKEKFESYQERISNLKKQESSPQELFEKFETLVKDFFKEYYNLPPKLTYLDLAKKFGLQEKLTHAKFCKLMSEFKYSAEPLRQKELMNMVSAFSKLIQVR